MVLFLAAAQLHAGDRPHSLDLDRYHWPLSVTWTDSDSNASQERFAGPFFERRSDKVERFETLRPLYLKRTYLDRPSDISSFSVLYPLFSFRRYQGHAQWSVFSLLRWSQIETDTHHLDLDANLARYYRNSFEFFPFYFDHDSWNPDYDYFGIFPLFGEVKNRLFYQRISWLAFPLYSKWERKDEATYAFLWPFLRYRTGDTSSGFAIWPLYGQFQREGDYRQRFALWPMLYYHQKKRYLDTPETHLGILPFYARETREGYIREDFLWPFFGYTLNTKQNYEEYRFPWPLIIQGRGDDRYLNQIAPLYSISRRNGVEARWWLWPLFNTSHYEREGIDFHKFRFFYFIYQNIEQRNAAQPHERLGTKRHLWPLFSYWEHADGTRQFQMFSPLEPLLPSSSEIRKLYSPLFSLIRYQELNPQHKDLELLFSLIQFQRRGIHERLEFGPLFGYEHSDVIERLELLKGLLGYRNDQGQRILRLFWFSIPLGNKPEATPSKPDPEPVEHD